MSEPIEDAEFTLVPVSRSATLDRPPAATLDVEWSEPEPAEPTPPPDEPKAKPAQAAESSKGIGGADCEAICRARESVRDAEALYLSSKERAKEHKAQWEASQSKLIEVLDAVLSPSKTPSLFDQPAGADPADAVEDESWRGVPVTALERFGVTPKTREALEAADLGTIGKLADFTTKGGLLTDIKGVGAVKAESIEQALVQFWADRNAAKPAEGEHDDEA